MEKIKEALAKVKSNKKTVSQPRQSKKSALKKNISASADIGHIEYTTSTVFNMDANHLDSSRIVSHLGNNANSSIIDSLRTQILQKMEENNWQTLAIISPVAESGKTVVSINLAISMAHQPQKTVVLADFDLRRPKIASYLGIQKDKSMNEYLENTAELSEIMVNPGIQRLIVIPTMRSAPGSANLLSSSRIKELIVELKERYESRMILFDLPPILGADDVMVLLPHIDCVLMVVANGVSTQQEIEDALHLLPKDKLLGIVYNKSDSDNKTYYY